MQEILSELNEYLIPDLSNIIFYYLSTPIAGDIHTLIYLKNHSKFYKDYDLE